MWCNPARWLCATDFVGHRMQVLRISLGFHLVTFQRRKVTRCTHSRKPECEGSFSQHCPHTHCSAAAIDSLRWSRDAAAWKRPIVIRYWQRGYGRRGWKPTIATRALATRDAHHCDVSNTSCHQNTCADSAVCKNPPPCVHNAFVRVGLKKGLTQAWRARENGRCARREDRGCA